MTFKLHAFCLSLFPMRYLVRNTELRVQALLENFPAVALLGPRQCGKSTMAKHIINRFSESVYLDLENPDDLVKLNEPTLFFAQYRDKLICLDEIQRKPEIYSVLRHIIDQNQCNGQFLILGSASPDLLKQSSESLAGRIIYQELSPFLLSETGDYSGEPLYKTFWTKGGFPRSFLNNDDMSFIWRKSFIQTFLERDLSGLGINYPPESMSRLWKMLAHSQGQLANLSALGNSMGLSHTMIRSYVEALHQTYMIRILQPWSGNLKKRLVKSPKIYIRDSGILHALLNIPDFDTLFTHPVAGASWETMVIENIIQHFPDFEYSFYRTSNGNEIDLVIQKGAKTYAVEIKLSSAPKLSAAFYNALNDLEVEKAWVVAPVESSFPLKENVMVGSLDFVMGEIEGIY